MKQSLPVRREEISEKQSRHRTQSGTISQLDFAVWDVERTSAAAHMLLLGRSNVVGEERAKGVSYTK